MVFLPTSIQKLCEIFVAQFSLPQLDLQYHDKKISCFPDSQTPKTISRPTDSISSLPKHLFVIAAVLVPEML